MGSQLTPTNPMMISPQGLQQLAAASPTQAAQLGIMPSANATPSQAPVLTKTQPITPESLGLNPSIAQRLQAQQQGDLVQSKLIKEGATANQLNQRLYGDMFKAITDKITPNMPAITKFASTYGKTGAALDRALAALGSSRTDPDYMKYDQFMRVDLPGGANELKRTLGGQATDAETKRIDEMFDPTSWATSPKIAMNRWNRMIELANAERQSGGKSQAEIARGLNQEFSPVGQALSDKSASNITIPTFNSKSEFQAWFKSKKPADQALIKQKMSNQ
jgi:hypothetical protein